MISLNVDLKDGKYSVEMKNEYVKIYDSNGKNIYGKDSKGVEYWKEYDSNGNCVHYKDSKGYEKWYEYDSNGNEIHYKDFNGCEQWKEYDANGNCVHYKNSNGKEFWYNSKGNAISKKEYDQIYSSCHGKVVEIDGKKYQLKEINHG